MAGALKALIEGAGLGLAAYRDQAPAGQTLPYITIEESISTTKNFAGNGDFGDPNSEVVVDDQTQVDLWERWKDPTSGALAESYTLRRDLLRRLDGAVLTTAPTQTHGVKVISSVRLVEEDENVVHTPITLLINRNL